MSKISTQSDSTTLYVLITSTLGRHVQPGGDLDHCRPWGCALSDPVGWL